MAFIAWSWLRWHRAGSQVPVHSYQLQAGRMDEWRAVGGNWQIANGVIYNNSYERGSKLLTGSSAWGNYKVNADIRFEGDNADMGVIIRTNNEKKEGSDTYNGYYIGVRTLDGTMVIGRSAFGWSEARPVSMPGGFRPSVWYRLHVAAYGCNIAASATNLTTLQTAWIAFEEPSCLETGHIGLRSLNAGGMWRNISVAGAGWNDYMELRQHAASVERPEVLPGPPWWTPWHVGVLFTATLALALLTQQALFRMQRWKAYTIMQERERLANQIHDTMAQSFAGVGYQIQGIRRSVLRGDHLDQSRIANQLSDAYQLVRSCHKEASRTVSMLATSSPPIQRNLLAALAETAHKIAGDQIGILANLHGNPMPLNLRLADALLRIGQEAIANAVAHSDLTELTISLIYEENSVELVVEDNGCGFEPKPETAGFGILGMQKRAREMAGTLQILSTRGHGTQVRMKVGLQQKKLLNRILLLFKEEVLSTPPDFRG
jgi:signal transduction histidine kinase